MTPSVSIPAPASNPPPGDDDVVRLTLPVDPKTGFIAWDRVRSPEKTENTLRRVFADSKLSPRPIATPEDSAALNAVVVNVLYDAVGLLAVVVARSRGFAEDTARLLRFTADEKAALAPQTVKVLDKYNLLGGKYADEITLLIAVGGIVGGHVLLMQDAERKLAAPIPTTPMQPEPVDILGERSAS